MYIFICVLLGVPLPAHASGIQVSPAKLIFSLNSKVQKTSLEITIANPTADVQIYELYADNYAENFSIEPKSFTLESGARKTAKLTFDINGFEPEKSIALAGNISIVGQPLAESRVNTGAGVKLPFTVEIYETDQPNPSVNLPDWVMLLTGAGAMAFIIFIVKRFKIFSAFYNAVKR